MYSYVSYSQVKPYAEVCRTCITQMQMELKEKYGITMSPQLIGSGKNHLVLRNGKEPFDLDFNLYLHQVPDDLVNDPKKLKDLIRITLDKHANNTFHSAGQNSTSAITYVMHQTDRTKKDFSMDVGILLYSKAVKNWQRLIFDKNQDRYIWNKIFNSGKGFSQKEKALADVHWRDQVRTVYLKKKNAELANPAGKSSYMLYIEAVNDVFSKKEKK